MKKPIKTVGIIFCSLILLLLISIIVTEYYLEPYLKDQIPERIRFGMVEYDIRYEEMDIEAFSGNVYATKFSITPVKSKESISKNHTTFEFENIAIEGVDASEFLFNDKLIIKRILLENYTVVIRRYINGPTSDSIEIAEAKPVKSITIATLDIQNGFLQVKEIANNAESTLVKMKLSIKMEDINYTFDEKSPKVLDYNSVAATMTDIETKTADSLRIITSDRIRVNGSREVLKAEIENSALSTRTGKYELSNILGHESDWIELNVPRIEISNWQLAPLLKNKSFFASNVVISNPAMHIFRDKRPPFPDKKDSELPNNFIMDMDIKFSIDSVQLKNGNVTYEEHVQAMEESGHIDFNDLYISIYNFTNHSATIEKNGQKALMNAKAKLMNSIDIAADFTFPLTTSGGNSVKGTMGKAQLTTFNPMLSKVGYAKIESGLGHSMAFDFTYDNDRSSGELIFKYENLKIQTISQNDGDDGSIGQTVKTFLANNFVVKNKNPDEELRKGEINFERNKKKTVINFWWKSILTGIQTSIGLSGDVEK